MVAAEPSSVMEDVDEKCGGVPGEALLGHQLLLPDGALDEVPFAIFPCAPGGSEVDPGFRDLVLPPERRAGKAARRVDLWPAEPGQGGLVLHDAVGKLPDFDGVAPPVTMGVDHPGTDAESAWSPRGLGGPGENIDLEDRIGY